MYPVILISSLALVFTLEVLSLYTAKCPTITWPEAASRSGSQFIEDGLPRRLVRSTGVCVAFQIKRHPESLFQCRAVGKKRQASSNSGYGWSLIG